MSIFVDSSLIFRVLLAFSWGCGLAAFLQFNRYGQFLAAERTWITVVVGVGLDLAISYPYFGSHSDWYTVAFVISASCIGIIARSLHNEQKVSELNHNSYKLKHGLEDAISLSAKIGDGLLKVLDGGNLPPETVQALSRIITSTHRLSRVLQAARRGDYAERNAK